ncbi:MAG: hypothetical protein KAI47_00585, partial [Deltaproteobacteria bacterium]|nr:hypothetical protein [Deltaproteobacteria bacterium]
MSHGPHGNRTGQVHVHQRRRKVYVFASLAAFATGFISLAGTMALGGGHRVVYPPHQRVLRFSHGGSHAKVSCARCHPDASRSISARDRNVPRESACRSCHRKETRANELASLPKTAADAKRCTKCHGGYRGGGQAPARVNLPTPRIRFSHRLHHDRGVPCQTCHGVTLGRVAMPLMTTCLSCHTQRRATRRCGS